MKQLTFLALAVLSTNISAKTTDNDPTVLEKRPFFQHLDRQFSDYFDFYELSETDARPTLEVLKDDKRQKELYRLYRILGAAIDDEFSLEHLTPLGVEIRENGGISINLNQSPRWATLRDLMLPLNIQFEQILRRDLTIRGFTDKELELLITFLQQTPSDIARYRSNLAFIGKNTWSKSAMSNLKGLDSNASFKLFRAFLSDLARSEREWVIEVFELFELPKQRILLSYLQDQLGSKSISKGPLSEESAVGFVKRLIDGSEKRNAENALMRSIKMQEASK